MNGTATLGEHDGLEGPGPGEAVAARLPEGFTEKSANVDGVTISYKVGGQGPAVVLLHGYAQTSHTVARTRSVPEADRRIYAEAYARADGMRAGFEYFKALEQDAKDFAAFAATKLDMPVLVLTGEKASGTFLIEQARIVATHVSGTVVKGSGHWLMEEATAQVVPAIAAFLH